MKVPNVMSLALVLSVLAACDRSGPDGNAANDPVPAETRMRPTNAPQLHVTFLKSGVDARLFPIEQNGSHVTWAGANRRTLTTQGGIVITTRGLGGDLMSADVTGILQTLSAGEEGTARRVHRYLTADNRTLVLPFDCTVTWTANLAAEECRGPTGQFRNVYAVDDDRHPRQSE